MSIVLTVARARPIVKQKNKFRINIKRNVISSGGVKLLLSLDELIEVAKTR